MMPEILRTPAAENDLINIWVYIAQDNPAAADRVYEEFEQTAVMLADTHDMGAEYQTKRRKLKNIRFFPIRRYSKYIVYYRKTENGVEIIRVLHAQMKKDKHLS